MKMKKKDKIHGRWYKKNFFKMKRALRSYTIPRPPTKLTHEDWWIDAVETDTVHAMSIDGESKFWSSDFVPPPPRPEFLEDDITEDSLGSCDLCTWAWKYSSKIEPFDGRGFGWIGTLIAVSLLSALTGAIVMITIIRCKMRFKKAFYSSGIACFQRSNEGNDAAVHLSNRNNARNNKPIENEYQVPDEKTDRYKRMKPWIWLTKKSCSAPTQLRSLAPSAPDNHYTFEESCSANNVEALYAELDQETANDPAYQNAAYTGTDTNPDFQTVSLSSGSYYSHLTDRTYETVCLPGKENSWENLKYSPRVKRYKTKKTVTVPSDYI